MSKIAIVEKVAEETGLSKKDVNAVFDSIFANIKEQAGAGNTTIVKGFGSFKQITTKARKGRNPQTGAEVEIPAKDKLKFTPSKG